MRLADEVPGAGHGFRVVQFQAAIPPNSTGGVLLNSKGQMLGLLTGSLGAGGTAWAVPAESILGLAAQYKRTPLGSGKNLELPRPVSDAASAPREDANPYMALIKARTVEVSSRTVYFKAHMLEKELVNNAEFRHLGLNVVRGGHKADLAVEIDRPLLTYDFTYSVADGRTGAIVATGKVTAIDGPHAAPDMAKKLVLELEKARAVHATETEAK